MSPDGAALCFLESLWGGLPSGRFLIWAYQDKRSYWCTSPQDATKAIQSDPHRDLYVGAGAAPAGLTAHVRCPAEAITGICGVWADIDLHSPAHAGKPLPRSIDEARVLLPADSAPTWLVATGNGVHAWWLFPEPWMFRDSVERQAAANLVTRWQSMIRLRAASRGWSFERLSDLARVLRIPGTVNCKDPQALKPVALIAAAGSDLQGRRWQASDLEELLDDAGIPDPALEAQRASGQRPSFILQTNPGVPGALIEQLTAADSKFRATWNHARSDFADHSPSAYDLAIANFGAAAGLDDQRVVNLMVAFRCIHHLPAKLRPDYYERTLLKARTAQVDAARFTGPAVATMPEAEAAAEMRAVVVDPVVESNGNGSHGGHTGGNGNNGNGVPAPDPEVHRAQVCEYLSGLFGVRLLRILKIEGRDPDYVLELEQGKVEIARTGALLDQQAVRIAIASVANALIPRFKQKAWDDITNLMLVALTPVEAGGELNTVGQITTYLEQYLSETAFLSSFERMPVAAQRKPYVINGLVAVHALDVLMFITRTFPGTASLKGLALMLSAIGAHPVRLRAWKCTQSRWVLPEERFAATDYLEARAEEEVPE